MRLTVEHQLAGVRSLTRTARKIMALYALVKQDLQSAL